MSESRNRSRRVISFAGAAFLALALAAPLAVAQPDPPRNVLDVYLMGAGMSGTVGVGPLSTNIDVPASEVFNNLKFAVLLDYRRESPKWALSADILYVNLGADGTGEGGKTSANLGVEEFIGDLVGSYRISPVFEVLAGGRYTSLATKATLYGPLATREAKLDESWFDPVVGAQALVPLSKPLLLQLRGDIGGFGVGCTFTWQAIVRLNWQVSRVMRVGVGYRWLDQDYETGSGNDYFKWNVLTQGPLVAVGARF